MLSKHDFDFNQRAGTYTLLSLCCKTEYDTNPTDREQSWPTKPPSKSKTISRKILSYHWLNQSRPEFLNFSQNFVMIGFFFFITLNALLLYLYTHTQSVIFNCLLQTWHERSYICPPGASWAVQWIVIHRPWLCHPKSLWRTMIFSPNTSWPHVYSLGFYLAKGNCTRRLYSSTLPDFVCIHGYNYLATRYNTVLSHGCG